MEGLVKFANVNRTPCAGLPDCFFVSVVCTRKSRDIGMKWVCHLLATRPPLSQVCMRAFLDLAGCEMEPRCIRRVRVETCSCGPVFPTGRLADPFCRPVTLSQPAHYHELLTLSTWPRNLSSPMLDRSKVPRNGRRRREWEKGCSTITTSWSHSSCSRPTYSQKSGASPP